MLELTLDTTLDLAASGARHGVGLFETLRVLEGQPRYLNAHLKRLSRGAAFLGLDAPPETGEVQAFLDAHTNCRQLPSGVLRLLAVDGRLMVSLAPWEPQRPERIGLGVSYQITRWSSSPTNRFKTMAYLENRLLMREAEERGLFEVIALNESEALTDGGRTNLFLVRKGELLTPAATDGALPGVARSVLLQAGAAREASLGIQDLFEAEALFLTNALQGAVPVHFLEEGPELHIHHPLILQARKLLA